MNKNVRYCTIFSFTMVLSHLVFLVRFLMKQYHGHPMGSIMNNIMDVHKLSINLVH